MLAIPSDLQKIFEENLRLRRKTVTRVATSNTAWSQFSGVSPEMTETFSVIA
jgi:hypothetical protein